MKNFDAIFICMFLAVLIYQMLYFLVQYAVLKRTELLYYSIFLLSESVYYMVYIIPDILKIHYTPTKWDIWSSVQLSFNFIVTLLYIQFLSHYLELQREKRKIYFLIKYYSYYNLFFIFLFMTLGFLKIESQSLFGVASLLTMPITLILMVMIWRTRSTYVNVVIYSITCMAIGELTSQILIFARTDTYDIYGGNPYVPVQIGLLCDIFILGYGLSLKAAESDKKLVSTLLENQQIVEVERSRLARYLHDGLGGLLSGIKITLAGLAGSIPERNVTSLSKAMNQLDAAIKEMQSMAHNLMPEALLKFGLGEAIRDYCDGINETNSVTMKYIQIGSLQTLNQSTEIILYRIIQELTNNALKHALAKNIFVQINSHQKGINITVEDDGKGFDVKKLPEAKGAGIKNVVSRIDYLKGSWNVETEKVKGSSINIEIPY